MTLSIRRRKRKWPFVVIFFLCIGSVIAFKIQANKKIVSLSTTKKYFPVTWSVFTEFQRLEMLLDGFAIESMIDIPSIDQEHLNKPIFSKIRYIGIADSRDHAKALQIRHGSKLKTFMHVDIPIDILPKADLILCWDTLCNMPQMEVQATLLQFKKSGAHFLLMRHYPEIKMNQENISRGFQPINWTIPPYNFPEPIIHIVQKGNYGMESLALWDLESL